MNFMTAQSFKIHEYPIFYHRIQINL